MGQGVSVREKTHWLRYRRKQINEGSARESLSPKDGGFASAPLAYFVDVKISVTETR